MQTTPLSKQDENRIKKLEEAARYLKKGMQSRYAITKLSSIKTLCAKSEDAVRFGIYIANLIVSRVNADVIITYKEAKEWPVYKELISESVALLNDYANKEVDLQRQLKKIASVQNETRPGYYGSTIRTIYCNELFVIEKVIQCILSKDNASEMAYEIAKSYAEQYHSSVGTGLIGESLPMLQDIINFWRGSERID